VLGARAQIAQASLRIPRLGLQIGQVKLQGSSDGLHAFNFSMSAQSGDGDLAIDGSTLLEPAKGWPTRFTVKGNDFEVSRIPEAQVTVTPDLQVTLEKRSINITGDLKLPFAKLQPKDVSSAARVSNDTVIIGSEQAPEEKWLVTTRVNLSLGDRVTFFGFGFEGDLGGRLLIEDMPGQVSTGTGEITIKQGRYRAYGQRLDINNGRLLFTGSALDNPGLDLRATREAEAVTVGLQVRGRLQQPELELFSIPAMDQTDMLSYLLFGRPMESASGTEGEMMAKAALALGLAGGDSLARQLGDRFGFDEMRVESSNTGDQASLVVGRYLSPRLYVSYGVGLVESINKINLRYELSDRWRLEAESGEYQGADLLFSIER
jgi:translocation and assembly module TamB